MKPHRTHQIIWRVVKNSCDERSQCSIARPVCVTIKTTIAKLITNELCLSGGIQVNELYCRRAIIKCILANTFLPQAYAPPNGTKALSLHDFRVQ
jgi:hypothetical protein